MQQAEGGRSQRRQELIEQKQTIGIIIKERFR